MLSKQDFNNTLKGAIIAKDLNKIKSLISKGANVNSRNGNGSSYLHAMPNAEIAKIFIESAADVNAKCNEGKTPLTYALSMENQPLTQLLKDHGAKD